MRCEGSLQRCFVPLTKSELLERTAVEGKDASFKGAPRRTLVRDPEATCASPPCEDLGLARVV